ncbi:MAG TPA: hypothetical protein VFQ13_23750 [Anaerolineales bacterium]|nr:hypothetical protein [Anaerolineales bacterium]
MRVFITAIAIAAGLFVLVGYFIQMDALVDLQMMLIDEAIFIAGWAVIVGIVNLVVVHTEKFRTRQKGGMYSVLLVISLVGTLGVGLLLGPEDRYVRLAVDAIIVPVEASLMAILAVTLIYASIRLLRRRVDAMSVVFLAVALVFLILIVLTPLGLVPGDQAMINFLGIFSRGGARGLLIGIALGTLLTGLRVLFGVDRPYGGN